MCFTEQERLQYERAHEAYLEIQRRKDELPEKDKQLLKQLSRLKIGRYCASWHTLVMIAEIYDNNAIDCFDTIFRLGFLKGQRAEKARQKEKSVKVV